MEKTDDVVPETVVELTEENRPEITCDDDCEDIVQENGSLDENPCGDVVIDNLSDNMLKAWQDGDNC
jgi:hypothetical protein